MLDYNQIFICCIIVFIGSSILLKFQLNNLLHLSISWFVGTSAIVIFYVFLIIFRITINITNISIIYLVFIFLYYILIRKFNLNNNKIYLKNFIYSLFLGFICFLIVSYFLKNNLIHTADSLHYFSASRVFHQIINQSFIDVILLEWFFDARLIFLVAINNFAFLLKQDLFNLFIPINSLFFVIIIYFFFEKIIIFENKRYKYFLNTLVLLLLLSTPVFYKHSFFFHTNLLTSIYYTFGIVSICIYFEKKEFYFLLLSFFCLSLTCLIRKEMLIFSLIPIIYLNIQNLVPKFSDRLKLLLVFLVGFSYHIWKFFWIHKDITFEFKIFSGSHGGNSGEFIFTFCLILAFIFFPSQNFLKTKFRWILTFLGSLFTIIILFILKPLDTLQTFNSLLDLILFKGDWGLAWWLIILNLLVVTIMLISDLRLININFLQNFSTNNSIFFLYFIILCFFLFRIILYILYNSPQDNGSWDSGNRILLHIYPSCLILILYTAKQIYNKKNLK